MSERNISMVKENIKDIIALTPIQEGILFHYLKNSKSEVYHVQLSLGISGEFDLETFKSAWNWVVNNNDILKTIFRWKQVKNPIQIVLKKHDLKINYCDISAIGMDEIDKILEVRKLENKQQRYDFNEPPFNIELYKIAKGKYEMVINYHHILFDGWSSGNLLNEFFETYRDLVKSNTVKQVNRTSYKDFVKYMQAQDKEKQKKFWQQYLNGIHSNIEISIKKKILLEKRTLSKYRVSLDNSLKKEIEFFAKENSITVASIFYFAWAILLQRYNDCEEVIFGTTVAGRPSSIKEVENIVGLFINTLPLKVNFRENDNILKNLKVINKHLGERAEYENTPLVDIKKYSGIDGQNELFDTLVVIENYPLNKKIIEESNQLKIDFYKTNELTNYSLTLEIEAFDDLALKFIYVKELFDEGIITRMSNHFIETLKGIMRIAEESIYEIDMFSEKEKTEILFSFNQREDLFDLSRPIHKVFEDQVLKTPNNIAVIFQQERLSYRELNDRANQLANYLRKQNIKPNTLVGVCMERSLEIPIALLGILKAGGAYVPFDPEYPEDRLNYMIENSNLSFMITQSKFEDKISYENLKYVCIDKEHDMLSNEDKNNLNNQVLMDDLAYVIYTSGSTGKPKGAMNTHRGMLNHKLWMQKEYKLKDSDCVLQKTPFCFDVSIWEFFWTLSFGACLVIAIPRGHKDPDYLINVIEEEKITIVHFVPSMLNLLLERVTVGQCSSLRMVVVSGEALSNDLQKRFFNVFNIPLHNVYGPAECADVSTAWTCMKGNNYSIVPIGKPISNVKVHILDKNKRLCPLGVAGEIYIGGYGLGKGYVNNDKLTNERFIFNPFSNNPEDLLYSTGDIGRYRLDGVIEYIGRSDYQVKIRGFRIELSEIENMLAKHSDIKECVVDIREKHDGDKYLVGYIVLEKAKSIEKSDIQSFLAKSLPEYMIPRQYIFLDNLPLSHNGKIDRNKLLELKYTNLKEVVEPKSRVEKIIAEVWKETLCLDKVGVNDNFFDIGGNSLTIIRVNSALSRQVQKEIPIAVMFQYPTINSLAKYLIEEKPELNVNMDDNEEIQVDNESKDNTDVAIIGMAGRFPKARNIGEFWNNLSNGLEAISFFSDEELKDSGISSDVLKKSNYVKAKGYLENLEYFDAEFFGYSQREAEMMDPQLRILHECVWESLEDAGYNSYDYDEPIGLYLGASPNYYWLNHINSCNNSSLDEFAGLILNEKDFFSTRIAYKLNLKGPSITVQTACSTSLVAIDLAYQSVLSGKCRMTVAGGSGITYPKKSGYEYYDGMIFSPDGHCRTFDKDAKGTVAGNGVGAIVLKRLKDALQDGDNIYAVIKASAVNNDGARKVGFTAPSIEGQAEVIKTAIKRAKIDSTSIGYVETHGTATPLGDVVEIEALKQAFNTTKKGYCKIGSVKSNMGHLDCASGIAGIIKATLALKHKQIPPSLHFNEPNSKIDFNNSPFVVNTKLHEWKNDMNPLRAGVSSFGIGGTNAHIILEEAPVRERFKENKQFRDWNIVLISAKNKTSLTKNSEELLQWLKHNNDYKFSDISYTLGVGRKAFEYRKAFVCKSKDEAIRILSSPEDGNRNIKTFTSNGDDMPVVFMFSGIGSQQVNMGLDIYNSEISFREEIDKCSSILEPIVGCDLREILYPSNNIEYAKEQIKKPSINQPIMFMFEYALANLMIKWGVKPDAMIGYSFGEYVTACMSGVFTIEDSLDLIAYRGKLIEEVKGGAMLSVPLNEEELKPLLPETLSLAIVNGPTCVVAGISEEIDKFEKHLKNERYICIRLDTEYAIHSKMMLPIVDKLENKIKTINMKKPHSSYISNITGTWITSDEAISPQYWARHLASTIRFGDGIKELINERNYILIEIGPNRELCTLARHFIKDDCKNQVINLMSNSQEEISDDYYLFNQICRLWVYGKNIDWDNFYSKEKHYRVPLPTYSFNKQYYLQNSKSLGRRDLRQNLSNKNLDKNPKVDEWMYTPYWDRVPLIDNVNDSLEAKNTWLVFNDELNTGYKLIKHIKDFSNKIVTVKKGISFQCLGDGEYTLNPKYERDYELLFKELKEKGDIPSKIVHMWGIKDASRVLEIEKIHNELDDGYYSLLNIAKELGGKSLVDNLQIAVITNDLNDVVGTESLSPEKATVLGAVNVIPLEYPGIRCKCIDISVSNFNRDIDEELVRKLVSEINLWNKDNIVAYRGRNRWIQDFKPYKVDKLKMTTPTIKDGGVYMITGGLGGVGLILSEYLAKYKNTKLILLGRSKFLEKVEWENWLSSHDIEDEISKKIVQLKSLEERGAEILTYSVDISDVKAMNKVVLQIEQKFGHINGVIHAAGTPDGGMIQLRTKQMSEEVFKSKIIGTIVLDSIFGSRKLDFFVLCSSLSSILRTFGQVAYCSANAFLDAYAHYRNATEQSFTVSIDWDSWMQVGMAVKSLKLLDNHSKSPDSLLGIIESGIYPEEGIKIFDYVINSSLPQVAVSVRDFKSAIDKSNNFGTTVSLDKLRDKSILELTKKQANYVTEYSVPTNEIESMIVEVIEKYFGIYKVGVGDNFFDLGATSLDIIRISATLNEMLEKDIPVTLMFKYPTISSLAKYLGNEKNDDLEMNVSIDRSEQMQKGNRNLQNRLQIKKGVK